jgi:hypothetical protein
MKRYGILWVALLVYLIALGCALLPSNAPAKTPNHSNNGGGGTGYNLSAASSVPGKPIEGLPYCSVTMQLQRTDWIDRYIANVDEIAALGADTVQFVVDPRMENGGSSMIWLDLRLTPTPEQLGRVITHAKEKKLRVTLMPIVLLDHPVGDEWRGKIHPPVWEDWFDNYRSVMKHYAWIAEKYGVDLLVVGSELVSTEKNLDEWTKTIREIRSIYHGRLTYSSNWDHYTSVPFWDLLDLVGMNSYWDFGDKGHNPNPTVDQIVQRWREIQSDLFDFQNRVKKPIMFLEIGWFSQENVAYQPWDYTQESMKTDLEVQKKLYEGFFKAWWGNPRLGGFSVWEWPPDPQNDNERANALRGYTPEGKPAEQVLREWLSKPRWEVKVN